MTLATPQGKSRLLDRNCGAGGCTKGYQEAGFYVVGVDIVAQPNYCGDEFIQADAMTFPMDGFDAVHASPPCHDHANITGKDRKALGVKGTGWMLEATLEQLRDLRVPWVVENVATAKFPSWCNRVMLCGSSFGLDVQRHRWFASNVAMLAPPCAHHWQTPRFRSLAFKSHKAGRLAKVVGVHGHANYAGEQQIREQAMGIDWMTPQELTQAIPPAYTEWLGRELIDALERAGSDGS